MFVPLCLNLLLRLLIDCMQIAAIKEDLGEISKPRISMCLESDQPALLGGVLRTVTKPELMESFPSKPVADLLVARFFESYDPAIPGPSMASETRLEPLLKAIQVSSTNPPS